MQKNIVTIGYEIPGKSELVLDFSSKSSLMDADVILISPDLPYYERSSAGNGYCQGKVCYGEHGSFKLKEDVGHWQNELRNALKTGKTVFFLLLQKEDFFVDTGSRSFSGSGRNRSTTINVSPADNYELLPINIGTINAAHGTHIKPTGNILFNSFFEKFKDNLEYQVYFEDTPEAINLFTGKDKSKILGAIFKVSAGHLVVLPYLNYDEEAFTEYQKNEKGKKQELWTGKAIKFGQRLVDCLLEIDRGLAYEVSKTPPPIWVSKRRFSSTKEQVLQAKIDKNRGKIKEIENISKTLQVELQEEQALKDLLYEQGKPLENAVTRALKLLGFKAENYDDGELELDQVITSPEGSRYIGECEGKDTKDINITKFRHLLESLNADFEREEVEEKAFGILFGNAERLKEPTERTLDFTQKCKIGAKREKIALVRTIDLFKVARFLNENKNEGFQKKCRKAIHDGLGRIVVFPPVPEKIKEKKR